MSTPPEARPGLKWYDASSVKKCMRPGCKKEFGMFTWRNQCFSCGGMVLCSDHLAKAAIPRGSSSKEQTVCYGCYGLIRWCEIPLQLFQLSLLGCYVLTQVDLEKLKLIKQLPDWFLNADSDEWRFGDLRLKKLTHVDLSPLSSVESVGSYFLCGWSNLQSVDLRPFSNVTSVASCFLYGCSGLQSIDLKPLSNVTTVSSGFLYDCPKLTKKDYLDQVDLTPLLHIPDGKIEISEYEDKENNLKKALQRVRAGGANGGPKFIAPSSSATAAASSASDSNSSGVASAPKKYEGLENAFPSSSQVPSQNEEEEEENENNSSGVEPAPERKHNNSSGVAPGPNSSPPSSSPTAAQAKKAILGANEDGITAIDAMEAAAGGRTSRFSFEENAATEQQHAFDASFDVLPSNYKPARSASEAYRDVLSLLSNPKMDQNELDAAVAQVQQKANSLAAKAAQQHSLSSDQLFAVLAYTADVRKVPPHRLKEENNAWHFLNRSLGMRSSVDFQLHSPLLDFLSHIIAGVSKLPSERNIVVWRACKKPLNELSSKGAYSNKGTRLCFPGFSSVSRQGNVSVAFARDQEKQGKNHGSLMAIRASCVYGLKEFSMFPYEDELLMLPNTFVVVDDVQFDVDYNKNLTVKSLGTVVLPAKLDVVLLSQTERPVVSSSPSSPTSAASVSLKHNEKPVDEMDEDELCAFLKARAVNPKVLEVLKQEVVTGLEFMRKTFFSENEDMFSGIRKSAFESFKDLHAKLSSSPGGTGSSATTAASH